MWPALKTSSPNSNSPFFRGYYLWIVIIAFALSLILYWAFRLPDTEPESATEGAPVLTAEAEAAADPKIGVQPPSFQQITEYRDGSRYRLRLAGAAEPDTVIVLTDNKGERLRQVRVNELPSIRSEETIFHLKIPNDDKQALIMVTAPGSPSRIIQSPFGDVPTAGPLALSVIDYDHSGGVIITGTSSIPGRIRIYAQDAVIGETGIGVSGRWNYIAGRTLPPGDVEVQVELIAAQGIPDAPEGPIFISVSFNLLPPLKTEATDETGDLSVNIGATQWQIRRTLIGGGGQSTVIFAPNQAKEEAETEAEEE